MSDFISATADNGTW